MTLSADQQLSEHAPLLLATIGLITGIVVGSSCSFLHFSWPLYLVFAVSVFFAALCGRKPFAQSMLVIFSVMLFGALMSTRQKDRLGAMVTDREQLYDVVVLSEPTEKAKTMAVQVLLAASGQPITCYVQKDERSRRLQPGDGICMLTSIKPGWHYTLRCYVAAWKWQGKRVSLRSLSFVDRARIVFLKWRHRLLQRYRLSGGSADAYGVLAAMTLGDKSALNAQLRDTYSVTGASHVLALSGLHLGIIYTLLSVLMLQRRRQGLGPRRASRLLPQVVTVLSVWAYAMLVGLPVSVVRSALMISIFALFSLSHRPHLSVNLLCVAAIVILLFNPLAVYDVGFQLSFMAVFGILVFMPLLKPHGYEATLPVKHTLWARAGRGVRDMLWVSLAAQLGVAPILVFYFGRFSTYFLLTNLVVLPAAYLILCGALLMFLLSPVPMLGSVVSSAVLWVVASLNHLLTLIAKLPIASLDGLHLSVVQVFLYYVCLALLYGATLMWQGRWFAHRE